MIRRLYLANGILQAPLSKTADDIPVDAGLNSYILSQLEVYDWGYLTISWGTTVEVVKVYLDYSGLNVYRAQDGTCRQAFPQGASIKYLLTQAEIQDATPAPSVNIYADGSSAVTVSNFNAIWTVSYALLNVNCEGGVQAYFSSSDDVLYLSDYYPAAGCLTAAGNGAPLIGGPDYYLTSQPYPYIYEEQGYVAPNPNTRANNWGNSGFGFGPIWTLTQPLINNEFMKDSMQIPFVNVFGSQGAFSSTEKYIKSGGVTIEMINVFGGQKSFSSSEKYMKGDSYILQMLTFGSEITYKNDVEKYVKSTMSINNLTVA